MKIGNLSELFKGDNSAFHIREYMELKGINIPFLFGAKLSIESLREIQLLSEGYSVVYMLYNFSTKRAYIGSTFGNDSSSLSRRLRQHRLNDQGLENFEVYILKANYIRDLLETNNGGQIVNLDKEIREAEAIFISEINPEENTHNNIQYYPKVNKPHKPETIEKIKIAATRPSPEQSKAHIGSKLSETHKNNISKAGGREIIIIVGGVEYHFTSILGALQEDWIGVSERTLKRRLDDGQEFKSKKGIAIVIYKEAIDSGKITNDPKFIEVMEDLTLDTKVKKMQALLDRGYVYPNNNKRVTKERIMQGIDSWFKSKGKVLI